MQQYQQRLGGAVQELKRVVVAFDADAASEGLSRKAALKRYAASDDSFLNKRGVSIATALDRFQRIVAHRQALVNATAFERPALFLKYRDQSLFEGTVADYRPALPATTEGVLYAFVGFVFGGGLAAMLVGGWRRLRRGLRRPAASS
jgi:hypothetical protein